MKKIIIAALLLSCALTTRATDLWEGNHAVTWDNTLYIEASQFADMQVGQQLVLDITVQAEDVIELKSDGQKLPGTRYFHTYTDMSRYECWATADMLAQLQKSGLEICGSQFTVTKTWYGDGKALDEVPAGTIWTGYFWMDSWCTMELWRESLPADISQCTKLIIRHEAGRSNYILNIRATWSDDGIIAESNAEGSAITRYDSYAELDLTRVDLQAIMERTGSDRLMIQMNKEDGDPFNMTSVELSPAPSSSALDVIEQSRPATTICYDLMGRRTQSPHGLIIRAGKVTARN